LKLNALNINNAQLEVGDGSQGWQSNDFFDVVIVGSAVPDINFNTGNRLTKLCNYGC
jgi:protein-L-isoaspartate O-methyltransferase